MKSLILLALLVLPGCTASQALGVVNNAGGAAQAYLQEQVQTRIEFRAARKAAVVAHYRALMRAAEDAERSGELDAAAGLWAEAAALMDREMPDLKKAKAKVREFFEP